ncbi:hypothetical protein GGR52DRAFT_531347 [Hypoxylon sp. FL1284]|nr:hypothetical protein GGR52DRAFT_531347 [Hypoxylon sp. FL1284]
MPSAHKAFEALGPINWDDIGQDHLDTFLKDIFGDAQAIIDSIPISLSSSQRLSRQRSATDPNAPPLPDRKSKTPDVSTQLKKEWKEVKVNPRENPLGIDVYKLAAKDGKGAWFARHSLHDGLTFERWRLGMEKELDESLKVQGKPGDGSIRGIGADKRVVNQIVENRGKVQVYQLSAQFPGPTTPRDFITLLLSTESAVDDAPGTPRHYMLVSKPCIHPECPPQQGYIRGQYESVEFIREIKIEKPLRKTQSSIDLTNDDSAAAAIRNATENLGREATVRSAHQAARSASPPDEEGGRRRGKTIGAVDSVDGQSEDGNYETLVEWMMVTRSDPGGSVPRFMIERGTPPGIAGDANKFVKWVTSKSIDGFTEDDNEDKELKRQATEAEAVVRKKGASTAEPTSNLTNGSRPVRSSPTDGANETEEEPMPSGFYGIIANALNAAATVAASHIPNPFGSAKGGDTDISDLSSDPPEDDASSFHSFHTVEDETVDDVASPKPEDSLVLTASNGGAASSHSTESLTARSAQHEKELRKLEDRRRKMEEKLQRAQERALAKRSSEENGSHPSREEAAVQKLREKHEREVAKQQEKYQRELRKLEAKRAAEQHKAEERRRKALEREEKGNLAMELNKARAERDVARKQVEMLKDQVGDLQAQNTMLVARLGREGLTDDDVVSSGASSSVSGAPPRRSTADSKAQLLVDRAPPRRAETARS